jgi:hypothetical protein
MGGHVARMGDKNAYRILVGKTEAKRPYGISKRRWKDNIKIALEDIWC